MTEEGLDRDLVQEELGHEVEPERVDEFERVDEPEPEQEKSGKSGKGDKMVKGISKILGGDILGDKLVLNQIPLLLLCLFFLLLLVANRYKVESLSREKMASMERINDLREQRIQMQKQYQKSVKISQIAEDLRESGVGITSGPPYEIEK
ncbi:MAG: hypothetical protein IJR04_10750 [Bacteroidales bacterium]|nr:hypothetical protein [Bacteroidales bacterium]